jgi:hypothetical protein
MSLRWEYIGSLTSLSSEQWKETSNKYRDRYIILTQDKKLYACIGKNDLEGDVKSIEEIARLIQKENAASQASSSPLKEREIKAETKEESRAYEEYFQQKIKIQSEKNKEEDPLSIFSSTFDPILFSKSRRENYLNSIGKKPWTEKFFDFQKSVDKLFSEEPIESELDKFLTAYGKKYNISQFDLESIFVNQPNHFAREKLINTVFNKYIYKQEIDDFIEDKKASIISEFAPNEYKNVPKENFAFEIKLKQQETHNKGKRPAKIHFYCDEKKAFSVIYKPRAAEIDYDVQELLASCQIPSYKIISYPRENKSIWTYIDGQDMRLSEEKLNEIRYSVGGKLKSDGARRTPEAFIHYSPSLQDDQRNDLLEQLKHINMILLCINITDLHGENVRLGKDNKIYPIDLEVIDERQGTLLMIDDYFVDVNTSRSLAWSQLSDMEQALIKEWNAQRRDQSHEFVIPFRHVLVNSGELLLLRYLTDFEQAANRMSKAIYEALKHRGYSQIQEIAIRNQVYIDLLNNDVPFFTESMGIIYYGFIDERLSIGKRKERG